MSAPATAAEGSGAPAILNDWIRLLRPQQWVKNFFVLAPLLFSGQLGSIQAVWRGLAAFGVFCLLASGVYVVNDIADAAADRSHPVKKMRPLAAGRINLSAAIVLALTLWAIALPGAWLVRPLLVAPVAGYLVLNLLYSYWLKRIVILDVFAIAAFFMLRLTAGSVAVSVQPSIWLLLCGGLLALYLGFAKRRNELMVLGDASREHRSVLAHYGPAFLDQMSVVLLSVTIVSYIMYTVSPDKVAETGYALTVSVVFVLYGVFRYLYLVHQKQEGSPTETFLADRSLLIAVALWAVYCAAIIYHPF